MLRTEQAFSRMSYKTRIVPVVKARYEEHCRECQKEGMQPRDLLSFRNEVMKELYIALSAVEKEVIEK